jgi:hypothetical protein
MVVDVERFATSYGEEVRRARTETLVDFRNTVLEILAEHPESRDMVIDELRRYRAMFKEQGREDLEDLILDAMDIVTGWAAPDLRV